MLVVKNLLLVAGLIVTLWAAFMLTGDMIDQRYSQEKILELSITQYKNVIVYSAEPVHVKVWACDPFEMYVYNGQGHVYSQYKQEGNRCTQAGEFQAEFDVQGQEFHLSEGVFVRMELTTTGVIWAKVSTEGLANYMYAIPIVLLLLLSYVLGIGVAANMVVLLQLRKK